MISWQIQSKHTEVLFHMVRNYIADPSPQHIVEVKCIREAKKGLVKFSSPPLAVLEPTMIY